MDFTETTVAIFSQEVWHYSGGDLSGEMNNFYYNLDSKATVEVVWEEGIKSFNVDMTYILLFLVLSKGKERAAEDQQRVISAC